jgi:hypothetical protein
MLILLIVFIFTTAKSNLKTEKFVNVYDPKFTLNYDDSGYDLNYNGGKIFETVPKYLEVSGLDPNKQKYLQFLANINDKFKEYMPKTGSFRGSCDDKVNERIQKLVLEENFAKRETEYKKQTDKKQTDKKQTDKKQTDRPYVYKREQSRTKPAISYNCVGISNDLCETTDPYFYLLDSSYFPPPWTVASYKNIDYPKNTNLSCFNKTFDCCKSSLN